MGGLQTRLIVKDIDRLSRPQLIDYIGELEGQIQALKSAVSPEGVADRLQSAFGLTPTEARALAVLADGKQRTKNAILDGIYWDQSIDHCPELKIVDVFICKIRKKLDGSGVGIVTAWGSGYRLEGMEELSRILAGAAPRTDLASVPTRPGRMVGDKATPYATVREAALGWLVEHTQGKRATFRMRDFVAGLAVFNTNCSNILRNLERHDDIFVHQCPRAGKAGEWIVEVLRQPKQVAA